MFKVECPVCGKKSLLGIGIASSVEFHFHRGSPNIRDRMVICCTVCGNQEEFAVDWPLDIGGRRNAETL